MHEFFLSLAWTYLSPISVALGPACVCACHGFVDTYVCGVCLGIWVIFYLGAFSRLFCGFSYMSLFYWFLYLSNALEMCLNISVASLLEKCIVGSHLSG